jgi:hypothetical protein
VLICNRLAENGHRSLTHLASCHHRLSPSRRRSEQRACTQAKRSAYVCTSDGAGSTAPAPAPARPIRTRCIDTRMLNHNAVSDVWLSVGIGSEMCEVQEAVDLTSQLLYWLLPGALRHVVQVHMTGDDWQPLPAQQLTLSAASVPQWIERMLTRVRSGVRPCPQLLQNAVLHQGHSPPSRFLWTANLEPRTSTLYSGSWHSCAF